MYFHVDLAFLSLLLFIFYPGSNGKVESGKRSQDGVTNTIDSLLEDILSENYDNTEPVNPSYGNKKRNAGQPDSNSYLDTRGDNIASGITPNSDIIRPALSLDDKADLLRIKSHLHAIASQLDNIKLAPRTHVGERPRQRVLPEEKEILQSGESTGETGDEGLMENVISKKVIHHGKTLDDTKMNKPKEKVSSVSDYRQPLSGETSERKQKKVSFENDIDTGKNYDKVPGNYQQQNSYRRGNHFSTALDETAGQTTGEEGSSRTDYGKRIDETVGSKDFYPEGLKKDAQTTPFSGAFMGFSPTKAHPMSQQESPLSTLSSQKSSKGHNVSAREVSDSNIGPSLKKYIAEAFIKAFGILKVSLVKIDTDMEQGLRQMYSLETDHYNMATGDVRANGDKIERLQKFISNEMNVVKGKATNLTNNVTRLTQNIQKTVDRLVNITETLLNMTRTINDRTERINEIKEQELKVALVKGSMGKHHPSAGCHKYHHLSKGHSTISKQLGKQLRKHRQKLKHPLYHSLMYYLQTQHMHPDKQSKLSLINNLATVSNSSSPVIHKKLKKGRHIGKSFHRLAANHPLKRRPSMTKREKAQQKAPMIKVETETGGDEDSIDDMLEDDTDMD